ncbi:MAG: family 20 glycosylhydrolase [Thermoleophilia bacterium]|nr:family 20 glycosylhydrolase [Thermoleophilia bacterium]
MLCLTFVAVLAFAAGAAPRSAAVAGGRPETVPALRTWKPEPGRFHLRRSSRIVVAVPGRGRLRPVARVLAHDLGRQRGRAPRVVSRRGARPRTGDVVLRLGAGDRRLGGEGYRIDVGSKLEIVARRPGGAYYGTRTVLQLLRGPASVGRGRGRDRPRYRERGLMLDLGREAFPAGWIIREIRRIAGLKLNTLHLHLTDDQRWGLESRTHPELASPGALTIGAMKRILAVARRHRIEVVPEIDLPGHSGALLAAHPGLELEPTGTPPPLFAGGKLDITDPAARRLVAEVLREYMRLFGGRYLHIGADEYMAPVAAPYYPQLGEYARRRYGAGAGYRDAIAGFVNRIDRLARRHGKVLRAWNDQLAPGALVSVDSDVVVDWWTDLSPLSDPSPPAPAELLVAGHRIANKGWFPTYPGYLGGGPTDLAEAYEGWRPDLFCGLVIVERNRPCAAMTPGESGNLGSSVNAWEQGPRDLDTGSFHRDSLAVIAQKTWASPPLTRDFDRFTRIVARLGRG